ncbi:MAG: AAA family ATPase [Mycolicibacterium insubricum]
MIIHRLTLTNYRGIGRREVTFAERGVTLVSGANEIGKSSMIEALDLLLEVKDRSTKKEVKAVKPTHLDAGAEVEAEISSGPYRFVYRKRFHKQAETSLTVLAPAREQVTGDEAHDRVRAILAETVDTGLWQAQRVLQSASTAPVDLASCDALTRALDLAAGDLDDAVLSGDEPALLERIDAEYARYFTATGRPTGEWAKAIADLDAARAEVGRCAAAVAEVDARLHSHAELTEQITTLRGDREAVADRLAAARKAAAATAALAGRCDAAATAATTARATATIAANGHADRLRLCTEAAERCTAERAARAAATVAGEAEDTARQVADAAAAEAELAAAELAAVTARAAAAAEQLERLRRRDDAERLAGRLERIDGARAELAAAEALLSANTLTDSRFREIEAADSAVRAAEAQADVTATGLELTAETDVDVELDGTPLHLAPGSARAMRLGAATELRVPGGLTIRIAPPAAAAEGHARLVAAGTRLADVLAAAGVVDVTAAAARHDERRELDARCARLRAAVTGLCADEDPDRLREQLAGLRAELAPTDTTEPMDLAEARVASEAAAAELAAATRRLDAARAATAEATARLNERVAQAAVALAAVQTATVERTAADHRLAQARAECGDDELASVAASATETASTAEQDLHRWQLELAAAHPESVAAELDGAEDRAHQLDDALTDRQAALRDVTVELALFGTEGRTSRLDAAEMALEHATRDHARIGDRARSVQTLRSVMTRHRSNTQLRYVEPFRNEVQRLGRSVFGPTFEVEIDPDLRIRNRTLDGATVPYESLSGGAKEQLGILTRLAVAALVGQDDAVPVLIDDALGFTDPQRLSRMGAVFDLAGSGGQVIVLTCSPSRFDSVPTAHRVELSA